jgi:membrane fusion protein (multidrug efflux system)
VTGGLAEGDQVVVSGLQMVREGALAKATPWTEPGQDDRPVQQKLAA